MVQICIRLSPPQTTCSISETQETTPLSSYQSVLWTHARLEGPIASHGHPFPVLLFNPAWTGRRTQNTFLAEELASHGYIVAGIDHTYNSGPVAFPDGRVVNSGPIPVWSSRLGRSNGFRQPRRKS